MKKVLFVINTLGGAGAEKALLELLKRFPENEYEVLLYVLLAQGELTDPSGPGTGENFKSILFGCVGFIEKGKAYSEPADLQTSFYERSYFQKSWIYAQKYGRNAEKRKALSG